MEDPQLKALLDICKSFVETNTEHFMFEADPFMMFGETVFKFY